MFTSVTGYFVKSAWMLLKPELVETMPKRRLPDETTGGLGLKAFAESCW